MSALGLSRPVAVPGTLRVLAALLSYPDAGVRGHLPEMLEILRRENALPVARRAELEALIANLRGDDPLDVEAEYVQLFDRGRGTSLHLFEHVHGDSRDRGPAMIDLALRSNNGPVALAAISQRQQISLSYLEQLFGKLRRHELVESTRGPGGGYSLGRKSDAITVADIIVAVD